MSSPLLELQHVWKGFGRGEGRTEVLRDISLTVARGELLAIVGYSGSGKTTLVNLMAGLTTPDAGAVLLSGKPVTGPGADRGVVFQNYSLLPWMSAYDNIALAVDQTFPSWSPDQRQTHAEDHLALVGLRAARDKKPAELSGGMRQRVALARALAMDPEILLLDEPLGALDALTRATLQGEIARLCGGGKTAVLVTNDVDEAILLADRIVPLSVGPAATLGPVVAVPIPRPRDGKILNRDPAFRAIRNVVIEYLLGPGRKGGATIAATTAPRVASTPPAVDTAGEKPARQTAAA